jgi:hypothetical protein
VGPLRGLCNVVPQVGPCSIMRAQRLWFTERNADIEYQVRRAAMPTIKCSEEDASQIRFIGHEVARGQPDVAILAQLRNDFF